MIGPPVDARPARRPEPVTLAGRFVTVAHADAGRDAASLFDETHGEDAETTWRYLFDGPYPNRTAFAEALDAKARSTDPLVFAILDRRSGQALGAAAYLRIEPSHQVVEIGSIVYGRRLRRTPGATEAMYLLARHAFETLGYRRYEWKCDALNEPSRRAAVRLGFTFEGVFRHHMIVKGRSRDTAWYSMISTEWPECRRAFEAWLDPANFDAAGRQLRRLADLRVVPR